MNFLKREGENPINLDTVMRIEAHPDGSRDVSEPHILFVLSDQRWSAFSFESKAKMLVYYTRLLHLIQPQEIDESDPVTL
jgi:hypothetical protein